MRPPIHHRPNGEGPSRSFILRLVVLIFIVIAAFESIGFYVDSLWFDSLGYEAVYWYGWRMEAFVFAVFAALTTIVLWTLFRMLLPNPGTVRRPLVELRGETIALPSTQVLRSLAAQAAVIFGILFGLIFSNNWRTYALFLNQPATVAVTDPVLGKSLSFYFFTLPVLESLVAWSIAIGFLALAAAIVLAVLDSGAAFKGVSLGLSVLLAGFALQTYVSRFTLLLDVHGLFSGARYVDDHVVLPGLWFVIAALLLGAIVAAVNVRAGRLVNIVIAVAGPVLAYVVAGVLVPGYVSTFIVRPNEFVRETPYIRNNIEFTREAFGIDRVEKIPFEPRVKDAVFDPAAHVATLDNIRLWDWRALQATLRQIQEIRTYYDFPDVDVDRYVIDGKPVEMMLATRELSLNKLPAGSRNWVNERLIYTHGYGVTMNPVSRFTKEGLPELVLANMPVESTHPDIQLKRPEIYFGELTNWPVYVKTGQKEFNYPEGDNNNYITYDGTGGIRMGSFFRRLLLAWTVGDLTSVPFSDDITADSALLMRRDIRERVSTLAPFLLFDDDPYVVVGEDGALYWMMDAFTTSDRYPYSQPLTAGGQRMNYIRNSVKVVIDAYNGSVKFYVFDTADPLIMAYQKMFPSLFSAADQMPDFLRSHVRYPELLLQVQATMYATYHVENEQVFYNHEDIWTIAQQNSSQSGQQISNVVEPLFILMQFPGETTAEFISILPFTPSNRNNLIGWIAARSDGAAYGTLRAYEFPKTRFVDGPAQIQARIDQDPQLSSQLTLWNQQGSTVIRGNLLVMPLGDTLLFAEPIYLQAERSPMPELRLVVLATQDRLAYATRFPEALENLLKGTPGALLTETTSAPTSGTPVSSTSTPTGPPPSARAMVDRANQALSDYRRLTAEGKLGEAGARLDELKRTLEEMSMQGGAR